MVIRGTLPFPPSVWFYYQLILTRYCAIHVILQISLLPSLPPTRSKIRGSRRTRYTIPYCFGAFLVLTNGYQTKYFSFDLVGILTTSPPPTRPKSRSGSRMRRTITCPFHVFLAFTNAHQMTRRLFDLVGISTTPPPQCRAGDPLRRLHTIGYHLSLSLVSRPFYRP